MVKLEQIRTYWDDNPREQNEEVIDGLQSNMLENGFNSDYPLKVFYFDDVYNLSDGHHRYEAAIRAAISEVPVDLCEGGIYEHIESLCIENMKYDVARGTVAQMLKPKEKKKAIQLYLTVPHIWGRTDSWIAKDCNVDNKTVFRYREELLLAIANKSNPLNLPESQILEIEELTLKAERVNERGHRRTTESEHRKCKLKAIVEDVRKNWNRLVEWDTDEELISCVKDGSMSLDDAIGEITASEMIDSRKKAEEEKSAKIKDLSNKSKPAASKHRLRPSVDSTERIIEDEREYRSADEIEERRTMFQPEDVGGFGAGMGANIRVSPGFELRKKLDKSFGNLYNAIGDDLSAEDAIAIRRKFLKTCHPDKVDTGDLTDTQKRYWDTIFMSVFQEMLQGIIDGVKFRDEVIDDKRE